MFSYGGPGESLARVSVTKLKRFWLWVLMPLIALFVVSEVVARYLGLDRPVLYEKTDYGYRAQPNQQIERVGNRIFYNALGLRSEPVDLTPKPGVLRVLCIGDSITNGGAPTDQAQTYPYLLEGMLRSRFGLAEVLNASAGGWALENEEGWLRAFGTFGSRYAVLELGTHDLFQPMAPSSLVDTHPSFPSHSPSLAWQAVLARFLIPRVAPQMTVSDPGTGENAPDAAAAQDAIRRVLKMADFMRARGATPIVLHVEQPASKEPTDLITSQAKAALGAALAQQGIDLISARDALNAPGDTALFRDEFHPNPAGNRVLAQLVFERITRLRSAGASNQAGLNRHAD